MRLFGDKEGLTKVEELSGSKLLNLLRNDFLGIPVIMTTASNKAWNQEKLMRLGADGYWIKESIDGGNTPKDSVENYKRFLWLIEKATGDKYKFLNYLSDLLKLLKNEKSHWWQEKPWTKFDITYADEDNIYKILDETLQILRTYLHYFEMGYGFQNILDQDFWHSAIIRHSALTLEEVHGCLPDITLGGLAIDRKDYKGKKLIEKRNEATHLFDKAGGYRHPISWNKLQDFLNNLIDYLYPPELR